MINNKYKSIFICLVALKSGHPVLKHSSCSQDTQLSLQPRPGGWDPYAGSARNKSVTKDPEGWPWERTGSTQWALDNSEKWGTLRCTAPWRFSRRDPSGPCQVSYSGTVTSKTASNSPCCSPSTVPLCLDRKMLFCKGEKGRTRKHSV